MEMTQCFVIFRKSIPLPCSSALKLDASADFSFRTALDAPSSRFKPDLCAISTRADLAGSYTINETTAAYVKGADKVFAGAFSLRNDSPLVPASVGEGLQLPLKGAADHELEAHETASNIDCT